MGNQPKVLITDGLPSYAIASKQVFDETKHSLTRLIGGYE